MKHGTAHAYKALKCRCTDCKAVVAAEARARRVRNAKYAVENPDDPRHGTISFQSNYRCKCDKCRAVRNDYVYEKRRGVPRTTMQTILDAQDGKCASCGRDLDGRKKHFDHNHETEELRGVLCGQCNMALGLLGDDPSRIKQLLSYRESYK